MPILRNRPSVVALVLPLLLAPGAFAGRTAPVSVRLESPNGGELLRRGETVTIRWRIDDDEEISGQNVALSSDGGETYDLTVATALDPMARSFTWTVPDSLPKGKHYRIRVVAYAPSGTVGDDESDGDFRVKKSRD